MEILDVQKCCFVLVHGVSFTYESFCKCPGCLYMYVTANTVCLIHDVGINLISYCYFCGDLKIMKINVLQSITDLIWLWVRYSWRNWCHDSIFSLVIITRKSFLHCSEITCISCAIKCIQLIRENTNLQQKCSETILIE